MGMAASQATFGMLTRRRNDIARQLEHCSLQKAALSRDMRKVTTKYQNSLSAKTLKWTNNAGASYVDLSYSNLMNPGVANQNKPYLITDTNGRVVVDSKYQKYAEMISADGSSGGDYEAVRSQILAELSGVSSDDLQKLQDAELAVDDYADVVNDLLEEEPQEPSKYTNQNTFLSNIGSVSGVDIAKGISSGSSISLGNSSVAKTNLKNVTDSIANQMSPYLSETDKVAFTEACNTFYESYEGYIGNTTETAKDGLASDFVAISGNTSNYTINISMMMDAILGAYKNNEGSVQQNSYGTETYAWASPSDWTTYNTNHAAWQTKYDEAMANYNSAVDTKNQILSANDESMVEFYDQIFSAIAEKGWTYNSQVEDNDYLNQMFQNNQYFITTVDTATDNNGQEYYTFDSGTALNFDKIVQVNDTDAQNEALVQYEYEKSIISEKESRIDQRMQNLQTEQSAINEMMKGVETVRNDNTERNFSIMS